MALRWSGASPTTQAAAGPRRGVGTPQLCSAHRASRRWQLQPRRQASRSGVSPSRAAPASAASGQARLVGTAEKSDDFADQAYLNARYQLVCEHFPRSLEVDDFLARLEVALFAYGFTSDNAIAMSNMCRDEITGSLKNKIERVFGYSFNTTGLGAVLTCGTTGVKAGLSHSPISAGSGKERYVFLSFPHVAVDAAGRVGKISRCGRPDDSSACGALIAALADLQTNGLQANRKLPGVHDYQDPEFSILKQRLARRMAYEGLSEAQVKALDLVHITKLAERTITDDLEYLIEHTVNTRCADYAVVTGVQIHSWGTTYGDGTPNLEFICPATIYAVVAGEKTHLDLAKVPRLSPRQLRALIASPAALEASDVAASAAMEPRSGEPAGRAATRLSDTKSGESCAWPGWQSGLPAAEYRSAADNSARLDETAVQDAISRLAQSNGGTNGQGAALSSSTAQ